MVSVGLKAPSKQSSQRRIETVLSELQTERSNQSATIACLYLRNFLFLSIPVCFFYAETMTGGLSPPQQVPTPSYSKVNKKEIRRLSLPV